MYSSLLITLILLAIVLATSTRDLYCYDDEASKNVNIDQLIGNQFYVLFATEPQKALCISFQFNRSTQDNNDLTVTTYLDDKEERSVFMQYLAPGQYRVWNTSNPGFNPSQPGNVDEIGKATFTTFFKIPGVKVSAFIWQTCYLPKDGQLFKYQYAAISSNLVSDTVVNLARASFKTYGITNGNSCADKSGR